MGTRVVLDTNVLVSGLGWRGPSRTVVRRCLDRELRLLLSPALLTELERVLAYPKFRFSQSEIIEYLDVLAEAAEVVEPGTAVSFITEDESDNRILECALAGKADYIVSGDRHLKKLGKWEGIPIFSPRAWIEHDSELDNDDRDI